MEKIKQIEGLPFIQDFKKMLRKMITNSEQDCPSASNYSLCILHSEIGNRIRTALTGIQFAC